MTRVRPRVTLVMVAALGLGAAHGAAPDPSRFIGTWTFQGDGQVVITCPGAPPLTQLFNGVRASIYPGPSGNLIFDIGCSCTLGLSVDGSDSHGSLTNPPQSCTVYPDGYTTSGSIQVLALDLAAGSPPTIAVTLSGGNVAVSTGPFICSGATLTGSGTLTRTSDDSFNCGDPTKPPATIGVFPTGPNGTVSCPLGAGMEAVQIAMDDEEMNPCSDVTGSRGEGSWLLPDDTRSPRPVCGRSNTTVLDFCRVDGSRFKPMTTAGDDPSQYYAVLKLADDCPNGGITMSKTIDNEDQPAGLPTQVVGNPAPSDIRNVPNATTISTLEFCYYRAATSADGVMTEFPDLGFPYAVLHSLAGEQPPWVLAKRWLHSHDESPFSAADSYGGDLTLVGEFQALVENPVNQGLNTNFNLARVR